MQDFAHVTNWVFDLDNTLYHPSARLFDQIEIKMEAWIIDRIGLSQPDAKSLRSHYWAEYGTTLAGLMAEHGIDPWDFLLDVHDIDMTHLPEAPELAQKIQALPGRRIVYTNGDAIYAGRVLKARGLDGIFDAIYGIEHADWHPKPRRAAFEKVFSLDGIDTTSGAMFEDDARNLEEPHALGMRTVFVAPSPITAAHIHHHTTDLTGFLSQITG